MYYPTQFLFLFLIYVKLNGLLAIQCHYYNETCGSEDKCSGIEECANEHHCYVLWSNSTKNDSQRAIPYVKLKGCFLGSGGDCSGQKTCIDRGRLRNDDLLFCCCKDNLCNKVFSWNPTPPPPIEERPSKADDTATILAYAVLPLSCFLFIMIMYLFKRQKISYFKKIPLLDPRPQSPNSLVSEKLRRIDLQEVIAQGKFGAVRKAILVDKKELVAVKVMSIQEKQSWMTEQEIYKLPQMDHDNILRFIGAEKRGDNLHTVFWLITAYHELGSLHDFLKSNTVTWEQMCHIAYTMARGLTHLHEEIPSERADMYKPAVAHRDFKSSNVLLKNDLSACIADFGLALIFRPSRSCGDTHGQVGTRRYMAPEILEGAINFSRDAFLRIDMYACGLVLWEIASRCTLHNPAPCYKLPFEAEVGSHPSLEDIQDAVVHKKSRPALDNWKKHEFMGLRALCETIEECWDHDAEARLSASCVMERMSWYVKQVITQNDNIKNNHISLNV